MSLPLPEDAWKFAVNSTYQDVMKTFMNLVTASLVLPLFLIRNFVRVREGEPIADYLSQHLRRILKSYLEYYHRSRTHLALAKDSPEPRAVQPPELGAVVELSEVGGLHH